MNKHYNIITGIIVALLIIGSIAGIFIFYKNTSSGDFEYLKNYEVNEYMPIYISEEKMAKIKIPIEVFKDAISQVMVAASDDTTRPALTGVYFNTFEKALYFAATDGYRLAERKVVDGVAEEISVIIPAVSLRTVVGLLDDNCEEIELLIDDSFIEENKHLTIEQIARLSGYCEKLIELRLQSN